MYVEDDEDEDEDDEGNDDPRAALDTEMLEPRLDHVAASRPVAQCQLRVGRVLRFGAVEPEELFDFEDARLLALYLDEESEGQLVEDDLSARDAPRLPPLLVDERGTVAE